MSLVDVTSEKFQADLKKEESRISGTSEIKEKATKKKVKESVELDLTEDEKWRIINSLVKSRSSVMDQHFKCSQYISKPEDIDEYAKQAKDFVEGINSLIAKIKRSM